MNRQSNDNVSKRCSHPAETGDSVCVACGAVLPPAGMKWTELGGADGAALAEEAGRARSRRLARSLIGNRDENDEVVSTRALLEIQSGRCGICGGEFDWDSSLGAAGAVDRGHLDHILPLDLGGRHVIANLQMTHRACNLAKGSRFLDRCPWPAERQVSRARLKERAGFEARNAHFREYRQITDALALTPRQVRHIEIANRWERLPIAQKTLRWKAWLEFVGPAPEECGRGMRDGMFAAMRCGEIDSWEMFSSGVWRVADMMDSSGPPAAPYPGWKPQ